MRIKGVPPNHILEKMSAEDRPTGKAGMTRAEAELKQEIEGEKELQKHMANLLNQRGMMFFQVPFGKKTNLPPGYPDFTIFLLDGRVLLIEAKAPSGGKLSDDQFKWHLAYSKSTEGTVHVVRSIDQFRELLNNNS